MHNVDEMEFKKKSPQVRKLRRILHHIILVILAIIWIFPVYVLVVDSLKTTSSVLTTPILLPAASSLHSIITVFDALIGQFFNSVIIAISTAVISTFVGAMAAYYFYRVSSKINDVIFTIIAIATFIPFEVTSVPLDKLLIEMGLFNSIPGLIFAFLIFYLPTGALLMSIFLAVLPKTTIESARIDGANDWTIFSKIVIPLTYPGLISTFIFIMIETWNNFFLPLVATSTPSVSTISLSLLSYTGGYGVLYNDSFAAALIASIFPLIVFIVLGRYFVRGLMAMGTGAKG